MKTSTSTAVLNGFAIVALMTFAVLFAGVTDGAEPQVTETAQPTVTFKLSDLEHNILPVRHDAVNSDDDGTPRAREDVIPIRTAITGTAPTGTTPDKSQAKITSRYSDAKMLGFMSSTNMQQLVNVYREAAQMIDSRHVMPPSYESRSKAAVQSVVNALQNEYFLRANNVTNRNAVSSVQNQLMQLVQTQPARDLNGAIALMQMTADMASRSLGIRREAIAFEFLNGTIDSLDQYSSFIPEESRYAPGAELDLILTASLDERLVGIGVELKSHAQGVEIADVIENSPASELGLKRGDIIIAIGQQSMAGRTLNEVADKIAGRAGTSVTLDILRDGRKFRGTAVRREFYVSSVTGTRMVDTQNGVGYIRLKQFSQSSAEDLEKALWTLHNQGMKGLILDLRGNPGGLLDESIDVVNLFLPCGTIVSTKGRNASDNTTETAKYDKTWSVPLTVLVDENSASASEIFAAAVQDNRRGVVIGRNSYGKGTVQTHFPMQTVSATLKLTTAKFYSPSGREMAGAGVQPDIAVPAVSDADRGTDRDQDILTSVRVFQQGLPAQMATNAATCRNPGQPAPTYNFDMFNNTNNYNNNFNNYTNPSNFNVGNFNGYPTAPRPNTNFNNVPFGYNEL